MATTTKTLTVDTVLDFIGQLDAGRKRFLAIQLLQQFDGNAILGILRQLEPVGPDYEDPGPITDEELLASARAAFLAYDREEAENEATSAR